MREAYAAETADLDLQGLRKRACVERFSDAAVACAILGDWEAAKELAGYPDERCRYTGYKGPDEEWNLALALADWLQQGRLSARGEEHLQKALQGKAARPREEGKLLAACVRGELNSFVDLFPKFMQFYKSRVFPKPSLTDKQSKAGTFWYHWFMKNGSDLDPERKWANYLIRLPEEH